MAIVGLMKVMVTGGAGFIGSHLVDRLINKDNEVVVVDNLSTGRKENLAPGAVFYGQDIRDPALRGIFEKEKPDIVFHFAAQASVARSVQDPIEDADVNVLGSLRVYEEARRQGVKKFVFASTGGALYGEDGRLPAGESDEPTPHSPYAVSKLTVERYLEVLFPVYHVPYAILRFANVYGPRQDPYGEAGVVAIFADRIRKGEQPFIHGDGRQTRDFLYVGDAVEASVAALKEEARGVYHIGTGRETSISELFRVVKGDFGSSLNEAYDEARPGEQRRSCLDASKAQREFGWVPATLLEEGVRRTQEWLEAHD